MIATASDTPRRADPERPKSAARSRRLGRGLLGWTWRRATALHVDSAPMLDLALVRPIGLSASVAITAQSASPRAPMLSRQALEPTLELDGASWQSGLAALNTLRPTGGRWRRLFADHSADNGIESNRGLLILLVGADLLNRSYGPLILPHPLYKFQREGIDFLLKTEPGALLADDMGLGKTVQAIVALRQLFHDGEARSALIVAPKSVITSWIYHFAEWAPTLRVAEIGGPQTQRAGHWRDIANGQIDVAVITYDSLRIDFERGRSDRREVGVLIADEVQQLKNPKARRTAALRKLSAQRRWGLTGTPLENSVDEFASVLHFVDRSKPDAWSTRRRTDRTRRTRAERRREREDHASTVKRGARGIMLRRRKDQVLDQLPKLVSHDRKISLSRAQRRAYEQAERRGISTLRSSDRSLTSVLALIHELKIICNGFDRESAKLEWLEDYVDAVSARGEKVLVFSQYTHALPPIVKDFFTLKYWGDLSGRERDKMIETFKHDPKHHTMLMSVRAASLGLNLQAANHVVHFDSWWNPAVQMQATARAHRLGQDKTVFEETLISTNTIEEGNSDHAAGEATPVSASR